LKFTEQEINDAELKAEEILCINCNIIHDEKDCSSCEDYYRLRDKLLVKGESV